MTCPSPTRGAGTGEKLLPGPHGSGRLGLVTMRDLLFSDNAATLRNVMFRDPFALQALLMRVEQRRDLLPIESELVRTRTFREQTLTKGVLILFDNLSFFRRMCFSCALA